MSIRTQGVAAFRRTLVVAAGSAVLILGSLAIGARGDRATGAEVPFVNGVVKATAVTTRFAPGVGSFELAMSGGVAVSQVTNDLAQAQAQTLDTGLIGTSLTAEPCDGGDPTVSPEQLPQPTRVDNRKGDANASNDDFPVAGATFGGGREEVAATKQPLARAIATSAAAVLGPLVTISGGRAEAKSEVTPGRAREAVATVEATIDIAGIVQLRGMQWRATHRTGADPFAEATFTVAQAASSGLPLPIDQLGPAEAAVNTVLEPSGIRVEFPRVQRFEEPADLVRVTPMRIVLRDSPAGKAVLGPVLGLTRTQREQLFDEITAIYCRSASLLLVGDISLSVIAGTGFMAVEVGGAEATTEAIAFEDPFGSFVPLTPPPIGGFAVPPASGVIGGFGGIPPVPGTPGRPGSARPAVSTGPLEERCESSHPFNWPPCSTGAAVPFGILALLATGGVAALDFRHQRARAAARAASTT